MSPTLRAQCALLIEEITDLLDIIRLPGHRQGAMVTEMRRAVLSLELLELDYRAHKLERQHSQRYAESLIHTIQITRIAGWRAAAQYITKENAL